MLVRYLEEAAMPFGVTVGDRPNGQQAFMRPLGAGQTVFQFWSAPAQELGLPLLGRVYEDGLTVRHEDLNQLESELSALESRWAAMPLDCEPPLQWSSTDIDGRTERGTISLRDHLRERAAF